MKLCRLFDLDVYVDWTLVILVALLAIGFSSIVPDPVIGAAAGTVYALLLVLSVFAHELGHVFVGRHYGVGFHRITLYILGGAAHMSNPPKTPKGEFLMAIAGPAVSIGISILGFGLLLLVGTDGIVSLVIARVVTINIVLGIFNLLPGFPMDGGRVLRAALWHMSGDFYSATLTAGRGGIGVGYGMIGLGALMTFGVSIPFFGMGVGSGLWICILGWLISFMAKREIAGMK